MMYKNILIVVFTLTPLLYKSQDLTARQIIEKADAIMKGVKSTKAEMTITTIRPKWTREMSLKSWSKGSSNSMIYITAPAKEKGTTFLMKEKEVWNWLPSIERTIKMPPSMMMQSWMGTDFTNDDLVQQSSIVVDYEHNLIGDSIIDKRACYKLELIPKEDAPVVWGKIYSWVDKKDFIQLRVEFYDEDDYLINIMLSSEIKVMGGKLLPTKMEMIPVEKKGQKTIMTYKSIEFDIEIEDSFFSIQNMKRLR